jgi:hypothetical protein
MENPSSILRIEKKKKKNYNNKLNYGFWSRQLSTPKELVISIELALRSMQSIRHQMVLDACCSGKQIEFQKTHGLFLLPFSFSRGFIYKILFSLIFSIQRNNNNNNKKKSAPKEVLLGKKKGG